MRAHVLATALLALLATPLPAPADTDPCPASWTRLASAGPAPRAAHGIAYDSARRQTVVFGGTADLFGTTLLADTWGWDGLSWTRLATSGPQPRRDGFLVYDESRGRVVLFGGTDTELITGNRYFPETWEWDGVSWSIRARTGPPGRNAHALAYDAARRRVVLFGGGADHEALPGDVWEWDGSAWTRVPASGTQPGPRVSPLMVYDSRRRRIVVHGGFDTGSGQALNDTWEWDGSAWSRRQIPGPSPAQRNGGSLAYDPVRGAVVLFGGFDPDERSIPGVWELDASGWHERESGPAPRWVPTTAYDTARSRLVMFGGITRDAGAFGDTWERTALPSAERLLPIALDVVTDTARFTTELTLTNRGEREASVTYRYTASLGSGSGSVADRLPAGRQTVIPDALAFLREKGLAIPPSSAGPQAGTLLVTAGCGIPAEAVSVTARTTTPTVAPLPEGRAGLAYAGLAPPATAPERLVVHGLRASAADRSNVAVYSASPLPVTLRITALSGAGDGTRAPIAQALELPPYGWAQYSFGATGLTSGRVLVERVAGEGSFGAYGVVNDNVTSDGSFVPAAPPSTSASTWLVPVLVETSRFQSELVLANGGREPVRLELSYRESLGPAGSGSLAVDLGAGEQRILPSAVDFLRQGGVPLGTAGQDSRAGTLRVRAVSGSADGVWLAARTASPAPGGGQFGLFTPGVPAEGTGAGEGTLCGLHADATTRSNAGFANAGAPGSGVLELSLQVYGGEDGQPAGDPRVLRLEPGQWSQVDGILSLGGVASGWVRVRRVSGASPWLAYGVLNDGGQPGERTGDGAYVEMEVSPAPAP